MKRERTGRVRPRRPFNEAVVARQAGGATARTLAEVVYERLRTDILWGKLEPSQPLRSEELRLRYGIGVSPLREALTRLVGDGLATNSSQRGFRVAPLTVHAVQDITDARIVIESDLLAKSIDRGGIVWEAEIATCATALLAAPTPKGAGKQAEQWAALHKRFHFSLLADCESDRLMHFAKLLFDQAEWQRLFIFARASARIDISSKRTGEHDQLLAAALARDKNAALRHLAEHYQTTARLVIGALRNTA